MFLQILNNPVDLYKLPAYQEHRSYVKPAIAEQVAMTPIEPAEGGLTGLTAQDYKELLLLFLQKLKEIHLTSLLLQLLSLTD